MFQFKSDALSAPITRRTVLGALLVAACSFGLGQTHAADPVKVKFTLDWRFEGPSAPFLLAKSKGYFAAEGLDVEIDAGNGSAGAVTRVATGAYDMGFADFNALVEYDAKTPGSKIQGIYMVYNSTPAAVFVLKKSGVTKPADLAGKTLAAPIFDGGRKAWPAFAKANGLALDAVKWQTVEPAIRETLLARGDVDGITGFYFPSVQKGSERNRRQPRHCRTGSQGPGPADQRRTRKPAPEARPRLRGGDARNPFARPRRRRPRAYEAFSR